jgi:hypothetical protein
MQHLERSATDDALDVFDALMSSLGLKSERKWRKERLRSLKDLDSSALLLREVVLMLFDSRIPDAEVRKMIFVSKSTRSWAVMVFRKLTLLVHCSVGITPLVL